MSGTEIKIGVVVDDGGSTKKVTNAAELLVKGLDNVTAAATKAGKAVKASMAPSGGSKTSAVLQEATRSPQESIEYGQARAAAGTGAAGRDFAKQAQGLGGLVHVYATFAANLFAVSAAFRALSDAADTTNMIKGLDQLSAVSGKSLGSLAKQIAATTDGAISMREAMEAATKGSAAGLSSEQMLKMSEVAKKASQALGISMPDAISRLSRGISKLEPELLDELGIYTRLQKSNEDYARSIGKTVSSLTDYEKRQAFANAVLKEGLDKFSSIELQANPYDKVLSSIKDLAQSGLELVNKVLSPIVKFLAESPAGLSLALAAVGTALLKQAIPALGSFKESLKDASDKATALANLRSLEAKKAAVSEFNARKQIADNAAEDELHAFENTAARLEAIHAASNNKIKKASKEVYEIINKTSIQEISDADLATLDKYASKKTKIASIYKELADGVRNYRKAEEEYNVEVAKGLANLEKQEKWYTTLSQLKAAAERDNQKAATREITSNAAQTASIKGMYAGWKELNEQIAVMRKGPTTKKVDTGIPLLGADGKKQFDDYGKLVTQMEEVTVGKMSAMRAGWTRLTGSLGLLTGAVGTALNAFGIWGQVIGIAVGAFQLLDSWLTSSTKEMAAFDNAIEASTASVDNATRTLETFYKKTDVSLSIQGITALANAFTEVESSAKKAFDAADKVTTAMNTWDKLGDYIMSIFGAGVGNKLAKNIGKEFTSAMSLLKAAGLEGKYRDTFKALLNVDNLDKDISESFAKLTEEQKTSFLEQLSKAASELNKSKSVLETFKSTTEASTKAYQDFIQSTANNDPLFKLSGALEAQATAALKATDSIIDLDAAFLDFAKSPEKAILFGKKFLDNLVDIRTEYITARASIDSYTKAIEANDVAIKKAQATGDIRSGLAAAGAVDPLGLSAGGTSKLTATVKELQEYGKKLVDVKSSLENQAAPLFEKSRTLFIEGISDAFTKSSEYLTTALKNASIQAGLTISKAKAGALTGELLANEQTRIAKAELALQLDNINTSTELILSQQNLTAAIDKNTAQIALDIALRSGKGNVETTKAIDESNIADKVAALLKKSGGRMVTADMIAAETQDSELRKRISERLASTNRSIATQEASRKGVEAQITAAGITGARASKAGELQDSQKLLQLQTDINTQTNALYATYQSIAGVTSKEVLEQQNLLSLTDLQNKQAQELKAINIDIANAKARGDKLGEQEAQKQTSYKNAILERQEKEKTNLILQNKIKLVSAEVLEIQKTADLEKQRRDIVFAQQSTALEIDSAKLSSASRLYNIEESIVRQRTYALDLQKAELDNTKAISEARAAYKQKQDTSAVTLNILDTDITSAENDPKQLATLVARRKQITDELDRQKSAMATAVSLADIELNKRKDILDINKKAGDEQQRYNDLLKSSANIAESLKAAFGDIGAAVGSLVTSMAEFSVASEKSAKAQQDITDRLNAAELAGGDLTQLTKEYNAQKLKGDKEEVAGYGKIAGAAKSLFKEKSAGYKVMANVEKIAHATTIALEMKTLGIKVSSWWAGVAEKVATTAAETGVAEAGFMARLPIYIKEIYASWGKMGPWMVGAAALFIASKLGGSGSDSAAPFSANSEQIQQTQGTGQTWNSMGERVADFGGILGDDEAKANSIVNSLEILQDNSFKSLDYDNRLLRSFQGVADAIGKATGTIITSGLRTVSDKIALMLGTIKEGGIGSSIPLIGKLVSGLLGGGYSETQSLQSQRLELSGTFASVADNIDSGLRQITDVLVRWEVDGGWLGDDDSGSYIKPILGIVPEDVKATFTEVFSSLKSGYEAIADLAGADNPVNFVAEKLKTVNLVDSQGKPLKFDYTGLKGDEIRAELEAYFSKINNIAIKALFPEFGEFVKAGEDYGTTAIRVLQNTREVSNAFTLIGKSFTATGIQAYRLSDDLVKAAGGLDNFVDQAKFFADNFLTETERAVPAQKAVIAQLKNLGYESVDTKTEFKSLVQSLDVTTVAGQQAYQSLMDLAPGFIEVIDAVESQSQALKDAASNFRDFIVQIKEFKNSLLLGASSTLTPGEKYAEARAQFDAIYAQALAGDKTALSKVTNSAQTFLDASKTYFASSDAYTSDFNFILSKLDDATISAGASASVAELQLNALSIHTDLLSSINQNIALIAGVPAAAGGGRVSGLTLVGEMGPELVDFTTPGRVYTADQTAGMFAPGRGNQAMAAVVVELQQLRQEVTQLRKDQQKQTGDLIISNYDAHQKSSEEIATAVVESSQDVAWTDRSKSEIK